MPNNIPTASDGLPAHSQYLWPARETRVPRVAVFCWVPGGCHSSWLYPPITLAVSVP
jgi:hypothetical protein